MSEFICEKCSASKSCMAKRVDIVKCEYYNELQNYANKQVREFAEWLEKRHCIYGVELLDEWRRERANE